MSLCPIYKQAFFRKQITLIPKVLTKFWDLCLALTLHTAWLLNSLLLQKVGRPDVQPGRGWDISQGKGTFIYLHTEKSQPLVVFIDNVGTRETLRLAIEP